MTMTIRFQCICVMFYGYHFWLWGWFCFCCLVLLLLFVFISAFHIGRQRDANLLYFSMKVSVPDVPLRRRRLGMVAEMSLILVLLMHAHGQE